MLPGKCDALGRLHVVGGSIPAGATYQGGIAVSATGQVCYTNSAPTKYINGFGVTETGQLCWGGAPIKNHQDGIPRNVLGQIVAQVDATPASTDPYLGGLRIGSNGVYFTTTAPA